MIVVTVFLSILNKKQFHLVQNRKENCHHDHIPFNYKGNGNSFSQWRDSHAATSNSLFCPLKKNPIVFTNFLLNWIQTSCRSVTYQYENCKFNQITINLTINWILYLCANMGHPLQRLNIEHSILWTVWMMNEVKWNPYQSVHSLWPLYLINISNQSVLWLFFFMVL